jgi:ubiquinone/menaquinone biosynthesis C-methylase UbiE
VDDAGVINAWTRLLWYASRLLYAQLAWSYDLVAWLVSGGQWRAWQRVGLAEVPAGRGLEIAFGPGHLLRQRADAGAPLFGLDLSHQMIRQAARRLRKANHPLRLVRGDVHHLPFASGCLQGVLSTFPAEFIVHPAVHRETRRVLSDGGVFVVIPSARITGAGVLDRLLGTLGRQVALEEPLPGFRRALEAAGFHVDLGWVTLPRSEVMRIIARRTANQTQEGGG